jgi:uncharacterized membrane protein required for colicin V production
VAVDVLLVILLVGGFLLGAVRGAVRQLIIVGAWIIVFVASAYLRPLIGDWVAANSPQLSREYVEMVAFIGTFLLLFSLVVILVEVRGATVHLSQRVGVDEILGGILALGWTLLAIATVAIGLDTYYAVSHTPGAEEMTIVRSLHEAFERSSIVAAMHDSLIPGLMATVGLLLPAELRAVYA